MSKLQPLNRAWAAGVFDARVSIPTVGLLVQFQGTDEFLIKRFGDVIDTGKVWNIGRVGKTIRDVWRWETQSFRDSHKALLFVIPLLSAMKRKQATELIAKIERNEHWKKANPTGGILAKSSEPTAPSADGEGH